MKMIKLAIIYWQEISAFLLTSLIVFLCNLINRKVFSIFLLVYCFNWKCLVIYCHIFICHIFLFCSVLYSRSDNLNLLNCLNVYNFMSLTSRLIFLKIIRAVKDYISTHNQIRFIYQVLILELYFLLELHFLFFN